MRVVPKSFHTIDREEWEGRPEVFEAIGNEKNGLLLLESTWLEEDIRSKADVIKEFPNETLHFGAHGHCEHQGL